MSESITTQPPPKSAGPRPAADTAALAELRRLLGGADQDQVDQLRDRLDSPVLLAKDVSRVLAEAIANRSKHDDKLASALAPTIDDAIRKSIRRNPRSLVDAIFPIIGPSIRMAIRDTLSGMIETLNQALEQGLSWHAVKWRIEAYRTHKRYGEVVLLHTLRYRVEQVYLIHAQTGLLLKHVGIDAGAVCDSDLISGMLTAIQEFVRDAFNSPDNRGLDDFRVGDLIVCVKRGPNAVIAGVVRGSLSPEVHQTLQHTIESIHLTYADELEQFDGDRGPFESAGTDLESCLMQERREVKSSKAVILLVLCLVGCVVGAGLWGVMVWHRGVRWSDYLSRLRATPGIVVIDVERAGSKWIVRGMQDPLAPSPDQLAIECGFGPGRVLGHWEPYHALDPRLVLRRVNQSLEPPETVKLTLRDGILYGHGQAPAKWVSQAQLVAPTIAGISATDLTGVDTTIPLLERVRNTLDPPATIRLSLKGRRLVMAGQAPHAWIVAARAKLARLDGLEGYDDRSVLDTDWMRIEQLCQQIEKTTIYFETGRSDLSADHEAQLEQVTQAIKATATLAENVGAHMRVAIVGHSDRAGEDWLGLLISGARAARVKAVCLDRLPPGIELVTLGVGSSRPSVIEESGADRRMNRRVTFLVTVTDGDQSSHPGKG